MNTNNLLVSFSGGETSGFMAQWIKKHLENKYDKVLYVFANTGLENEQTLTFLDQCDKFWNLDVKWVEAKINTEKGKGTRHFLTDFVNAKRKGEPFESVINKFGIPNQSAPFCTRDLKERPIKSLAKEFFNGEKYDTAIGIRVDEIDRMNENYKTNRFIYPLINQHMIPATKPMINFFWKQMPFRLNLKGYQGNCVTCWKKSDKKLYQIAKENPGAFDFMDKMEREHCLSSNSGKKEVFFRNNRSAQDILLESQNWNGKIKNDADQYTYQIDLLGGESCEVFSECSGSK
jgi:hypothetical protein